MGAGELGDELTDAERRREEAEGWVGRTLAGRWELGELRGIGGMGAVYEAERPGGQPAAVKMLDPERAKERAERRRFITEGELMARVEHRSAVDVLETHDGAVPFFAMELLEGWEISRLLARRDVPFEEESALKIALQILDALQAYHEAGVAHLDIKPGNLLMTREGCVKLLDFGASLDLRARANGEDGPRTRPAAGTPVYMAPEQATGAHDEVGAASDVYAVGATLFEMLSGQRIRRPTSREDALEEAAHGKVASLAGRADVEEDVVALVDRALARRAEARWESAGAMRDAIAGILARREARRAGQGALNGDRRLDLAPEPAQWVDARRLQQMRRELGAQSHQWLRRAQLMAVDLWARRSADGEAAVGEAAVGEWVDWMAGRLEAREDWEGVVGWLERADRRFEDPWERDRFAGRVLDGRRLQRLLEGWDGVEAGSAPEETGRRIAAIVEWLPGERLGAVMQAWGALDGSVREALGDFVRVALPGREETVVGALEAMGGPPAVELVDRLGEVETEAAWDGIRRALKHRDESVRKRAAARLKDRVAAGAGGDFREQLRRMLHADAPTVRQQALQLARLCDTPEIGSVLAARATSEAFDALSASERRAILQVLADVDRRRAEKVAIELVQRHGFFASDAHKTTRLLAMGVLGEVGQSDRALEALQAAERLRFWNPREVRDRAEASAERVRRRQDGR